MIEEARYYQIACHKAIVTGKEEGLRRMLVVMPTGAGKTITLAMVADTFLRSDPRPVLWLAHQAELLTQAARALQNRMPWATIGIEQAGMKAHPGCNVICASMQTLGREGSTRLQWLADMGCSLIVLDEAQHGTLQGSYGRIIDRFGGFDGRSIVTGCTATAARLDNKPLVGPHGEAMFERQVFEYSLLSAINDGYLCHARGYRVETGTDISKVSTLAGDYNQGELSKAVNTIPRTKALLKHWQEVANNEITAVFCVSREHAESAAQIWRDAGYRASFVDGSMSRQEQADRFRMWRAGEIRVMASCQLLLEGFDFPAISCIVHAAPTQSWVRYVQATGRGTRPYPGKNQLTVIDGVDNTSRHQLSRPPMSLTKSVGMPADIDLQGAKLFDAKAVYDQAIEKGVRVDGKDGKTASVKEIATRIEMVDLIGKSQYAPEVMQHSKLGWIKTGEASYVIDLNRWASGYKRRYLLTADALSMWRLEWTDSEGAAWVYPLGIHAYAPFEQADNRMMQLCRDKMSIVRRDSAWSTSASLVTDGQIRTLMRRGVSLETAKGLTKGEASRLLAKLMQDQLGRRERV